MKLKPNLDLDEIAYVVSRNDLGSGEDVVYYIDSSGGGCDNSGDESYFVAGCRIGANEDEDDQAFYETERGDLWEAVSLDS